MKTTALALFALLLSTSAIAETIRVNPSKRLNAVFDGLKNGDTVIFERGVYKTDRTLELNGKANIKIQGEGRVQIVLDNLDDPVIHLDSCRHVVIAGIQARHEQPNKAYNCEGAVIEISACEQVAVLDCKLNGCGAAGVYASGTKDLVVADNEIFNNSYAAIWTYDTSGLVYRNHIHKNAADLVCGGNSDIVLIGNTVEKNEGNDFLQTDFFQEVVPSHKR